MTIMDKMLKVFGERCRWLTCDDYFHMTNCLLKKSRIYKLRDRFEELGFKHPSFAYELCGEWCDNPENCQKFEKKHDNDSDVITDWVTEDDGYDTTVVEKAADEIAAKEFSDNENVRKLYNELKWKYVERIRKELLAQSDKLKEIEDEVE